MVHAMGRSRRPNGGAGGSLTSSSGMRSWISGLGHGRPRPGGPAASPHLVRAGGRRDACDTSRAGPGALVTVRTAIGSGHATKCQLRRHTGSQRDPVHLPGSHAVVQAVDALGHFGFVGSGNFIENSPVIRRNPSKSDHRIFCDVGSDCGEESLPFLMISNQFQSVF